jgi:hypothetical protein
MGKKSNSRSALKASATKASKASKARSLTKELMDKAVRHIASEILAAKPDVNGRTPRGYAESLPKEGKEKFPSLNMNRINYIIKKDELKKGASTLNGYSNISSLTGETESTSDNASDTASDNASGNAAHASDDADNASGDTDNASDYDASSDDASESYSGSKYDNVPEKTTGTVGGRPKGSTDAAAKDLERRVEEAMKEVVKSLKSAKQEIRSSKRGYGILQPRSCQVKHPLQAN